MSLFIKICGLTSDADVAAAIDAGADAVGFVFADSVRRVTPQQASEAARHVPEGLLKVAVMRHPSSDDCRRVLESFDADVLQTDAEDFESLDVPDRVTRWPVLREGSIAGEALLPATFLYEGPQSGRGETVDWSRAAAVAKRGRMILAGGLNATNVATAIATVRPFGVDVSSGVEKAPGVKDGSLIRNFIRTARSVENSS